MTSVSATQAENRITRVATRLLGSENLILFLTLGYFGVMAPFTPDFATPGNLANVLSTALPLFVVAMGQTIVLITGGIDLSVTSTIALTSVAGAALMNADNGWLAGSVLAVPVGLLVMLLVGGIVGLLNGAAITAFRMPPFIVTLTSMMFFSGLAVWLTRSQNINDLPDTFNALGGKTSIAFALTVVLAIGAHVMLRRSLWGRWLYAVGHNPTAARISGLPVAGVVISAYLASGVLAAMGSVMLTGQAETASPVLGQRILLDVIGATVIGGTSLFGGKGKILWTLCGVLFIKLIDNSLNLIGLSYFAITMVKGGVILLAAVLDSARNNALVGNLR